MTEAFRSATARTAESGPQGKQDRYNEIAAFDFFDKGKKDEEQRKSNEQFNRREAMECYSPSGAGFSDSFACTVLCVFSPHNFVKSRSGLTAVIVST